MKLPPECTVSCYCIINPSEDPALVRRAVRNIFGEINDTIRGNAVTFTSTVALQRIRDAISSRRSFAAYKRQLLLSMNQDTASFLLNKQAAAAGVAALCANDDESPLGPIQVTLRSRDITSIIEWLTQSPAPRRGRRHT